MYQIFKIIIYVTIIPPLLFVGFVFIAAFIPSDPEPLEVVFKESCGVDLPFGYVVIERQPSRGFAPQGVSYSEKGVIQVDLKHASDILHSLEVNTDYKLQQGSFENFEVGKKLGICQVSTLSGYVNYQYAVW
ncbi:hypothetical protein J1N51_01940 [Psychrosphaera ytuae]|uniref:Uncharacterized protein n=1 Tax=Psychrosphaera ytuae TaxID=2820710 RepID=A0A975DCL2_9GAMM|nr:hypothetical protein [Psychrosphaera ytuae]QTH64269.1 hypothetical protein J1N51_01940 [Psychrosphaera ytuae]